MGASEGFEEGLYNGAAGQQTSARNGNGNDQGQEGEEDDIEADTASNSDSELDCPNGNEGADTEPQVGDEETQTTSLGLKPMYYYVDIPDTHESTYEASERNVRIDPEFEALLQEEHEGDIGTFLALPEIIPTRKRQRQQL